MVPNKHSQLRLDFLLLIIKEKGKTTTKLALTFKQTYKIIPNDRQMSTRLSTARQIIPISNPRVLLEEVFLSNTSTKQSSLDPAIDDTPFSVLT